MATSPGSPTPTPPQIVEQVADGAFFKLVHATTVVALYDDHEVWELLGYEGPSFDKGGYLHRGFDDLDWLPDPRVEEYDGPTPSRSSSPTARRPQATGGAGDSAHRVGQPIDHGRRVVVIIGSGAGGGTVAYELTTRASPASCSRPART